MSERTLHPMTVPGRPAMTCLLVLAVATVLAPGASAQQFNTDNYLSMPYGTATFVITHGARNSTVVNSFWRRSGSSSPWPTCSGNGGPTRR